MAKSLEVGKALNSLASSCTSIVPDKDDVIINVCFITSALDKSICVLCQKLKTHFLALCLGAVQYLCTLKSVVCYIKVYM